MDKYLDSIVSLSMQISKLIAQQTNTTLEERTATILQLQVLDYLEKNPKATSSEIAKHMNASLSSIAQLMDRLAKGDLIIREGDENDRRIVRSSLTDGGIEHLKEMRIAKREKMKKVFSAIDENDAKELIRIQTKILENLESK